MISAITHRLGITSSSKSSLSDKGQRLLPIALVAIGAVALTYCCMRKKTSYQPAPISPFSNPKLPKPFDFLNAEEQQSLKTIKTEKGTTDTSRLQQQCHQLKQADLTSGIFYEKNWIQWAFIGHEQGLINASQLTAASHLDHFLHHNLDQSNIRSLSHPSDLNEILSTFKGAMGPTKGINSDLFKNLSPLEQLVLFVPITNISEGSIFYASSWRKEIPLVKYSKDNPLYFMILSPTAIEVLFSALAPDHPVALCPTFGHSHKITDFLGKPDHRIVGVHCRLFNPQPPPHSKTPSSLFDMYAHDTILHTLLVFCNPFRKEEEILAQCFWEKYCAEKDKTQPVAIQYKKLTTLFMDHPFIYPQLEYLNCEGPKSDEVFFGNFITAYDDTYQDNGLTPDAFAEAIFKSFHRSTLKWPLKTTWPFLIDSLEEKKPILADVARCLMKKFNMRFQSHLEILIDAFKYLWLGGSIS